MQDGPSGFSITLAHDSNRVRVHVAGELDLATAPDLSSVLDELANDGHDCLLLDLDAVEFMDSSGLATIAGARRTAASNGHQLTIHCSSPQVRRVFEITGMLDHFTFE